MDIPNIINTSLKIIIGLLIIGGIGLAVYLSIILPVMNYLKGKKTPHKKDEWLEVKVK